jgi:hypothetical protein
VAHCLVGKILEGSREVGRLELRPTSRSAACSRPQPAVHLRFLTTGRDRWCPLRSLGHRSGVYPACTVGFSPAGRGRRVYCLLLSLVVRGPGAAQRRTLASRAFILLVSIGKMQECW